MQNDLNSTMVKIIVDILNSTRTDAVPRTDMVGITMFGVFELISGIIAFLAILIALSDRIIKNYDEVREKLESAYGRNELDNLEYSLHEHDDETLRETFEKNDPDDPGFEPRTLAEDISTLYKGISEYKRYGIVLNIWGVSLLIGYGIALLGNPHWYNYVSTPVIFVSALAPTLYLTLYSHFKIYHIRDVWKDLIK